MWHYLRFPLGLLVSILCLNTSHAQTWQRLGVDLYDVEWIDQNTIIAVGAYGTILKSTDKGQSWEYTPTGISDDLYTLYALDEKTAFSAGYNGTILRTTNVGETWDKIKTPVNGTVHSIQFLPQSSLGIAVTRKGEILFSSNQGLSWELRTSIDSALLNCHILDDSTIIATSALGKIFRSSDFGATWENVYSAESPIEIQDIAHNKGLTIAVGSQAIQGQQSRILRSTDLGSTWQELKPTAFDFRAHSIRFITDEKIIVGGQRPTTGDIQLKRAIYSEDGGETWEALTINEAHGFMSILAFAFSPADVNQGVAVGSHQGIYLTQDTGKNWTTRSYSRMYEPIDAIMFQSKLQGSFFFDKDTGLVYGADGYGFGYVMRTTDQGTTWQSIATNAGIEGVLFFNSEQGIGIPRASPTVNTDKKIFTVRENGKNWTLSEKDFGSDYRYHFTSKPVLTPENTILFSADSLLFESSDEGETWEQMATLPDILTCTHFQFTGRYGWATAQYNTQSSSFYKSSVLRCNATDRENWDIVYQDSGSSFDILLGSLWFIEDSIGFIGNRKGTLYRTTNAGTSWDSVAQFTSGITGLRFFSESKGLAVGGMIMYTEDSGRTWTQLEPWPSHPKDLYTGFSHIQMLPDARTIILTGIGVIVRGTFPDKLTSVQENESTAFLNKSQQELTISPNPVQQGNEAHVRLNFITSERSGSYQVYDIQGKAVLQNSTAEIKLLPNGAELSIPTETLSPGLYFLRITTDDNQSVDGPILVTE